MVGVRNRDSVGITASLSRSTMQPIARLGLLDSHRPQGRQTNSSGNGTLPVLFSRGLVYKACLGVVWERHAYNIMQSTPYNRGRNPIGTGRSVHHGSRSCEPCRARKKRCDGELPCERCTRLQKECFRMGADRRNPANRYENNAAVPTSSESNYNPAMSRMGNTVPFDHYGPVPPHGDFTAQFQMNAPQPQGQPGHSAYTYNHGNYAAALPNSGTSSYAIALVPGAISPGVAGATYSGLRVPPAASLQTSPSLPPYGWVQGSYAASYPYPEGALTPQYANNPSTSTGSGRTPSNANQYGNETIQSFPGRLYPSYNPNNGEDYEDEVEDEDEYEYEYD